MMAESVEEFYKRKFDWLPENLKNELGHFNVFKHEYFSGDKSKPIPYRKRDYYKITLLLDWGKIHYADKVIDVQQPALIFSNPLIPYKWELAENFKHGYFCIFDGYFFHNYGRLEEYSVFLPSGNHVFYLSSDEVKTISELFLKMFSEINSEYIHKYDVLRNLVFELLHFAMKKQPASALDKEKVNASQRIGGLFLELLERQFPIDENHPAIALRTASDFAKQLNVHINHLNRSVKETTTKTTTQLINDRILQEAKIILKHSNWNISEIAYALGFKEVTHFNNFFKKHLGLSPTQFRKS